MALFKVAPNKRHLLDSRGQPFFTLGVNYAGYFDRAWRMWEKDLFDPDLIARDFRKAQHSGFNTIRLFVHAALENDIRLGNFEKLDHTLSLAQDHDLGVMLTLNDAHLVNLKRVSDVDAKIAERYKDVPTIFAYDLQNEPVFYNLVAAMYPESHPAAVQTDHLVNVYGERVSRDEALSLRDQRRIPHFLTDDNAYFYSNALRLFLEYDHDLTNFIKRGQGNVVDFMLSDEAEPWHVFIGVLDATVDTWLQARIEPIRNAGCRQLLTVGWSWQHFATLPANRRLDVQQVHNYTDLSLNGFNANLRYLGAMRQAFPTHPILLGEFGWSNHSSSNPDTSQSVEPATTALYEGATLAYLRASEFAGAFKWMLNDVDITNNPKEANFGVFKVGDHPKPIRDVVLRFSDEWPLPNQPAAFVATRDQKEGMAYRFGLPGHITLGGCAYQDNALSWNTDHKAAHCFIKITQTELLVDALGVGQLLLAPWELLPGWDKAREANIYRVFSDSHRTRQHVVAAGQNVVLDVVPGAQYAVVMGRQIPTEPPPGSLPLPEPGPGEHVLLLGNADQHLQSALTYLRRFGPDFTFAPDEVPGRWSYVSVVATPQEIPEQTLESIRSVGAVLVERVVDDTPATTKALLDDMAARGQRFLQAGAPPSGEPLPPPPGDPAQPPPPAQPAPETYVVKPGDTLGSIAKKLYGDFRQWTLIYEANRDKISSPNLIRVGMELLLPPQPTA